MCVKLLESMNEHHRVETLLWRFEWASGHISRAVSVHRLCHYGASVWKFVRYQRHIKFPGPAKVPHSWKFILHSCRDTKTGEKCFLVPKAKQSPNVFWQWNQKKKKGELNTSACDLFLPVLQHFCKVLHWREYSPHDSLFNCMSSVSL